MADTLGELGLFYRLAPFAFVGGSLVPRGGQNPIEPTRLGTAVLHGPLVKNFKEIYATLDSATGTTPSRTRQALAEALGRLIASPELRERQAADAAAALASFSGALDRTMKALAPISLTERERALRPRRETPPAFWWRSEARRAGARLWPLAKLYGLVASWRMSRPPRFRPPVPVICVGNFVVGGAGKTPTALAIARIARGRGLKPGFLIRGYGGIDQGAAPRRSATSMARAWSATRRCFSPRPRPTVVGARPRRVGAKRLIEARHRNRHHG